MFSHIFGELLALTIPFGTSFLVTKYLPFAPLLPPGTVIPPSVSFLPNTAIEFVRQNNDFAISLIPTMIYLIGRIYFETMLLISSLIPHSTAAKYFHYLHLWAGVIGPFFHPSIQALITDVFNETFGNIGQMVYDLSKPEVIKAIETGKRIGLLIIGWFVLFLLIEIILRIVFFLLISLYNLLKRSSSSSSSQEKKEKAE